MVDLTKPLLILDVDETLLFATKIPLERTSDFQVGPYHVYVRPFLDELLQRSAELFDLAIWSSSGEDYLNGVVKHVIPTEFSLKFVWSRERCVRRYDPENQQFYFVKDLKKVKRLGYDLERVLIADDTRQKLERSYGNAVYVKPFFGEPNDDELIHLTRYLSSLLGNESFRRIEKRGWRRKLDNMI